MSLITNNKIKGIIFDLDGTLIDSEPNYYEADRRVLADYGILDFTEEKKKKYIGRSTQDMMKELKIEYQLKETIETLTKIKNKYYFEIAKQNTVVFPEMRRFLEILKANKYPMAIASGSSTEIIDAILVATKLKDFFEITVSSETVGRGKPAPDLFLATAKRLNLLPENCLVVEDSHYGVEAAKKASMYCIAIPYLIEEPLHHSYNTADMLLHNGMQSFSAEEMFKWLCTR